MLNHVTMRPCAKPSKPYDLIKLEYDYLLSPHGNAEKIVKRDLVLREYIGDLHDVIWCYEQQIR